MADESTELTPDEVVLEELRAMLDEGQVADAVAHLGELHPADQATVLARLDVDQRAPLLPRIPHDALAEVIEFLDEEARRDVSVELAPAVLGPLLDLVERDVAADVLHALEPERARETLASMTRAPDVAPLLPHPDESAGGRMTSDFVALHREWTVDDALSYLRRTKPDAEQAFYLYVVDDEHRLEGVVSLRQLVVATPEERVSQLMTPDVVSVAATEDQEEVARQVARYNFVALPVVDAGRHLIGVISVDDIMDVAEEEATEDMYRLAGLAEDESLLRPIARSIVPRLGWLLIAFVSVTAAAGVVSAFEGTIERVVALAVFMPMIAALGGNAGIQTITLVVRSIALGKVEMRDVRRVLQRELVLGIANGMIVGLLVGVLAYLWKENTALAVIAGVAMLLNMATAVTAGVLVPLSLRAVRLDPALASGVLVTTFTDVLGLFIFLGLATLMVERLV